MKRYYAKYMLYNLAFDLKRMLDDNMEAKAIHTIISKRLEKDFHGNKWKKIIWSDKTRPYADHTIPDFGLFKRAKELEDCENDEVYL